MYAGFIYGLELSHFIGHIWLTGVHQKVILVHRLIFQAVLKKFQRSAKIGDRSKGTYRI